MLGVKSGLNSLPMVEGVMQKGVSLSYTREGSDTVVPAFKFLDFVFSFGGFQQYRKFSLDTSTRICCHLLFASNWLFWFGAAYFIYDLLQGHI